MSGYLFPVPAMFGTAEAYISRGDVSDHSKDWNLLTLMGAYEVFAADYWSYSNPGPESGNGLLQVHKSGNFIQQVAVYEAGAYTRSYFGGVWSAWKSITSVDAFE